MWKLIQKNRSLLTVLFFIGFTWIAANLFVLNSHEQEKNRYIQGEMDIFTSELESITGTYEEFSQYIFNTAINQEAITSLLHGANLVSGDEKDALRSTVFDLLEGPYEDMMQFNFRQLHLHLADGTSFLRMHDPDTYGDSLYGFRPTVEDAQTKEEAVSGYEEGRSFDGYRYVFPLFHDDELIGSGEISLSLQAAIGIINDIYPMDNTLFILHESNVEDTILDSYQSNYIPSFISTDYVFDRNATIFGSNENRYDIYNSYEVQRVFRQEARDLLPNNDPFHFLLPYDERNFLVQFIPITNYEEEGIGYFISAQEDDRLETITMQRNRELSYVNGFFVILTLFFTILYFDRRKINQLATTDQLTGLMNRGAFIRAANRLLKASAKSGKPLAIALMDIDHFKQINDSYGHDVGDTALKEIADQFLNALEKQDLLARWGGEEFIVLMPFTHAKEAEIRLDAIRDQIARQSFLNAGTITISIGITDLYGRKVQLEQLISEADAALYSAKDLGRNRVIRFEPHDQTI